MSKSIVGKDIKTVLDGIINAPDALVDYLFGHEYATAKELESTVEPESKQYVSEWIQRMTFYLAVEQYVEIPSGAKTYKLSPFARDMIMHILNFTGKRRC